MNLSPLLCFFIPLLVDIQTPTSGFLSVQIEIFYILLKMPKNGENDQKNTTTSYPFCGGVSR
jgi:hypothetical protein